MDIIRLKLAERQELDRWVRGQSRDAAQARRARLILLLADGERFGVIRDKLDCDTNFIARWKGRFIAERWPVCTHAMAAERPVRAANDKRRAFFNRQHRENQRMAPRTGAVANCRWRWAMSRI